MVKQTVTRNSATTDGEGMKYALTSPTARTCLTVAALAVAVLAVSSVGSA
jgi:hypothetical protein